MATFKLGGLVEQIASTATAGGTTTLVNSSRQVQVFTGTLAQSVVLPDATTMSVGQKFEIYNTSTGIVTLKFNDASTLQAIAPSSSYIVKLVNNGTTNGTFVNIASSGSGSPGVGQVKYIDTTLTTLPSATPYAPDGTNVVSNDIVLFTNLSSNNNQAYKATVTGTIAWAAVQIGQNTNATPTIGDFAYIQSGTIYSKQLWSYNGTLWQSLSDGGLDWSNGQLTVSAPLAKNFIAANSGAEISTAGWAGYSDTQTATFTNGSANIGLPNVTGLYVGMPLAFTSSGTLPTNFTSGTQYFITSIVSLNIQVSATLGGTAISAGSAGTGTQTFRPFVPATGTGGTLSGLTFARSTSSPLVGNASFLLTQSNTTVVAGQGVSYDFSIDSGFQAQVLSIGFTYNASATFVGSSGLAGSDSDLEVYLYDKTNSLLIPVSPKTFTASGGNNFQFNGVFQTASNSTSYRLIIHTSTSSANATGWTFKFDNVQVGPQRVSNGTPVTDWVAYTPTIGGVTSAPTPATIATQQAMWRRIGDSMEIAFTFSQTNGTGGANGSGSYLIPLPTGYTADTNKVKTDTGAVGAQATVLGAARVSNTNSNASVTAANGHVVLHNSNNFKVVITIGTSANNLTTWNDSTQQLSNAAFASFTARVPITGWSSNVQMSSDADTRVVSAKATSLSVFTTGNPVIYGTTSYDTHGAYNSTTGRYTVPVSGLYRITSYFDMSTSPIFAIYKNGVAGNNIGRPSANIGLISGQVQANAGDIIDLRANGGSGAISNSFEITFEKVTGPAAVAATESVCMSYTDTAGSAIGNGAQATYTYATKIFDSHNAYSGGTYTVPVSGKYRVSALIQTASTTLSGTNSIRVVVRQNTTNKIIGFTGGTGATISVSASCTGTLTCLAGDTIDIQTMNSAGAVNATTGTGFNYLSIERVGN